MLNELSEDVNRYSGIIHSKASFEVYYDEFLKINPDFKGSRMLLSDIWKDIDKNQIQFDYDKSALAIPSPFTFTIYPGDSIDIPTGFYFYRVCYRNNSGYESTSSSWRRTGDTELLIPSFANDNNREITITNKAFHYGELIVIHLVYDNAHLYKSIIGFDEHNGSMITSNSSKNDNPVTINKGQILCYITVMDSHKFNF